MSRDRERTLDFAKVREHMRVGGIDLSTFNHIDRKAARLLKKHWTTEALNLDGLTHLNAGSARFLARNRGILSLNGLTEISLEAATALSDHSDDLRMNGLRNPDDRIIERLSRYKGFTLELAGLETSDAKAQYLSAFRGHRLLAGATGLSGKAAESLSRCRVHVLDLHGTGVVTGEVAKGLAGFGGDLSLSGVASFMDEALPFITGLRCRELDLTLLEGLSESAAEAIGLRQGRYLGIRTPTALTTHAASKISAFKGEILELEAGGIDDEGIGTLSRFTGELLTLHLPRLTARAAEHLSGFRGKHLMIRGCRMISRQAAVALAAFKGETMHLSDIEGLADDSAMALGRHGCGRLNLSGLTDPSEAVVKAFEGRIKETGIPVHRITMLTREMARSLTRSGIPLHLDGLKQMSDEVASTLYADRRYQIFLPGLEHITPLQSSLVSVETIISLNGLPGLTARCARAIGSGKGLLADLSGLGSLSLTALREIGRFEGFINLSGLKSLSEVEASVIGGYKSTVMLDGICRMPARIASILARGSLYGLSLRGLRRLSLASANAFRPFKGHLYLNRYTEWKPGVRDSLRRRDAKVFLMKRTEEIMID